MTQCIHSCSPLTALNPREDKSDHRVTVIIICYVNNTAASLGRDQVSELGPGEGYTTPPSQTPSVDIMRCV